MHQDSAANCKLWTCVYHLYVDDWTTEGGKHVCRSCVFGDLQHRGINLVIVPPETTPEQDGHIPESAGGPANPDTASSDVPPPEAFSSEQQRRPPGAQSAGSDVTVIPDDFDVSTAVPVINAGYSGSEQASSHGDIERLYGIADWTFQAAQEGRWSLRPANGTSDRPSVATYAQCAHRCLAGSTEKTRTSS